MSDESHRFRKPSEHELRLVRHLVANSTDLHLEPNWPQTLRVQPMLDGGMGSLRLASGEAVQEADRTIGRRVAELRFTDADGVSVLASLNVDQSGQLLELDFWKTDFSPLIRFPDDLPDLSHRD